MRVEVIMPQLGESIVEGTVVEWHKQVGAAVRKDEELFTLSTDKVDTGVPSPHDGVLVEILAAAGETISVGAIVAVIDTEAQAGASAESSAESSAAAASSSDGAGDAAKDAAPAPQATPEAPPTGSAPAASSADQRVSPVARKLLAEAGVDDPSKVPGSGVGGKIVKRDVEAFLAGGAPGASAGSSAKDEVAADSESVDLAEPLKPRREVPPPPPLTLAAIEQRPPRPSFQIPMAAGPRTTVVVNEGDRVEPLSRVRQMVAASMVESRRSAAHCATVWEADMTAIVAQRNRLLPAWQKVGVHLTYTPFFLAAVSDGLRRFPILNAALDGDQLVYRQAVHLGIASAWNDGLVVPVVRDADRLDLLGLSRAVNELHQRIEAGELTPTDVDQATFTVTNSGIYGSQFGVPTLFAPQVGILSIGGIQKRVVVGDDDSLRVRSMVNMCLAFDHRVVDFKDADLFMRHVTQYLERFDDGSPTPA